jgi:hypothetical protein
LQVPVYVHKYTVAPHLGNRRPSYLIIGGLVFTVLSHPFLESALGEQYTPATQADVRLLSLVQEPLDEKGEKHEESPLMTPERVAHA